MKKIYTLKEIREENKPFLMPEGFNPFERIPVRDAFPRYSWAQMKYFKDEETKIPTKFPDFEPYQPKTTQDVQSLEKMCVEYYNNIRRRDMISITERVCLKISKEVKKRYANITALENKKAKIEQSLDLLDMDRCKFIDEDIKKILNSIKELEDTIIPYLLKLCKSWNEDIKGLRESGSFRAPIPRQIRYEESYVLTRHNRAYDDVPKNFEPIGHGKTLYLLDLDDIMRYGIKVAKMRYRKPWYYADEETINPFDGVTR